MANILYYIPNLQKNWGGAFQYAQALLAIMAKSEHHYFLYFTQDEDIKQLASKYDNLHLLSSVDYKEPINIRISRKIIRKFNTLIYVLGFKSKKINYKFETPITDYIVHKYNIDIIHSPAQSLMQSSKKTPTITTMHDVQELHFPQFFTSAQRASRAVAYKNAIDNASAVIVSYQHIKNDLIKYFAKEDSKIQVCLLDMQNLWFDKYQKADILELGELQLPEKFIFYPAATWAHKNHIKLIEAIGYLKKEKKIAVNLVCTSHKTEYYSEIEKKIKELNLENQIQFIGTVSEQVLYSLYHKTQAVVIPTLYEAGSFPLMESLIMGIPVICSNTTSLPETIGNLDFVFDPTDTNDIADKIEKIVFDDEYRKANILNSEKRKQRLLNNNTKEIINNLYSNLYNKPQQLQWFTK